MENVYLVPWKQWSTSTPQHVSTPTLKAFFRQTISEEDSIEHMYIFERNMKIPVK